MGEITWRYVCLNQEGKDVTRTQPTTVAGVRTAVFKLLVDGQHGAVVLKDWRWNGRWKRFTFIDTTGVTHILKQVQE